MKLSTRLGAITATLALASGGVMAFASSGNAAAPPPIDVSGDHVTCSTMYGSFKFSPPIGKLPVVSPMTATAKLKLDGCTDLDNANVKLAASKVDGTMVYPNNDSTALLGLKTLTGTAGTFTVTWKTVGGAAKLTAPTTVLHFGQLNSALSTITTSLGSFTGTFGLFSTGTAASHGATTAPSVTGNFHGTDGGITSFFDGISSQDIQPLAALVASGKGITIANLGAGDLHLG